MNALRNLLPALTLVTIAAAPLAHAEATPVATPAATPATTPAVTPAATEATPLDAAKAALRQSAFGMEEDLLKARAQLAALQAADPKSPELHYWVALADYRLVPRLMSKDKKEAERYVKDGIAHLDEALKANPKFADALALEAGLQGLSIALDPSKGMMLGGQIEESLGRAAGLEPTNPRVALLDGINTLNKPAFVGGGAKKALAKFEKAQQMFAAQPAVARSIDWGHDEAYVWAGRAAAKMKNVAAARAYYHKALEIEPDNGWVRNVLLPELDKIAKGKS